MKTVWLVAVREANALLDRRRYLLLALLVPIGNGFVLSAVYWHKKVTDVPVTIVDQDNSALSRQITRGVLAGETFGPARYSNSMEDFRRQVWRGQSQVCFVFPHDFERDVKSGRGATVAVWVDVSNLLIGNLAVNAASTIIGTYSAGVDVRRSLLRGAAAGSSPLWTVQPIADQYRLIYNPAFNSNYTNFLLLGLVIISVQLLTMLLASQSGSSELEQGTLAELQQLTRHPLPVIVGKTVVYVLIMVPVCLLALVLPAALLKVPLLGSSLLLAGLTVWFVTVLTLATTGLSHLVGDSLITTEILAVVAMPSFLISGYTWPIFAMPRGLQVVASALPLTPYAHMVRRITMMGATPADLHGELTALSVWSVVAIVLAVVGVTRLLRFAPRTREAAS